MSNELAPALAELTRVYRHLADYLAAKGASYPDATYDPVIAIVPRGRRKVDSWYRPSVWQDTQYALAHAILGEDARIRPRHAEIAIAADTLQHPDSLPLELLHQMVHHANWQQGRPDTSGFREIESYAHNRQFYWRAESFGFRARKDALGWVYELSPELRAAVDAAALNPGALSLARLVDRAPTSRNRYRLYICHCPQRIRAATDTLDAWCNRCRSSFELKGEQSNE
jgi:hypothetical protein